MGRRDVRKRLKGMGIPIEVCVKYERRAGLKPGQQPDKRQADLISSMMVSALVRDVQHDKLTVEDLELIAREIDGNKRNWKNGITHGKASSW